jgi:regulator of replication initiation timing
MSKQHEISEYIEKMSFKKKFGGGFEPDSVYETVRELTSMYNDVLAESYQEVADLKETVSMLQQQLSELSKRNVSQAGPTMSRPMVAPSPKPAATPSVEDDPPATDTTTDKTATDELRRMNRRKLLEVLLASSRENQSLHDNIKSLLEKNRQLQTQLDDKKIRIETAGTIAEAAFQLNGVMESAQNAAEQYLDNLQDLYKRETVRCEQKEALAQQQAQSILDNATAQCDALIRRTREQCSMMESDTQAMCDEIVKQAREKAEEYWLSLDDKLEAFYAAHKGLKEMLGSGHGLFGGDNS